MKNSVFRIYPNPTKDGFVFVQNLNKANQIKIIDARGRTLKNIELTSSELLKLNLSPYGKGLYYIVITTKDEVFTEKIILQ